jgi:ribonuclease HII
MICGIDEAGRGPLAGPVCAAAVILPRGFPVECLRDSKKLSEARREKAAELIRERSFAWGIGWASHREIDAINILQASLCAMRRAFFAMAEGAAEEWLWYTALVRQTIADGLYAPALPVPCAALVKADDQVPAVMAASILAKTARDDLMRDFARYFPEYRYEKHKGYPTKAHKAAIARFGLSPLQRRTFQSTPPASSP